MVNVISAMVTTTKASGKTASHTVKEKYFGRRMAELTRVSSILVDLTVLESRKDQHYLRMQKMEKVKKVQISAQTFFK